MGSHGIFFLQVQSNLPEILYQRKEIRSDCDTGRKEIGY